ncbi:MAG: hypothetical protein AAF529_23860 [Pseudomonadota bacterium]
MSCILAKRFPLWGLLLVLSCSHSAQASDEVVISDDGRQIQLNADGTWVQLSRDRFATNAQGQRIRLRPDGTWSILAPDAGADTDMRGAAATARVPGQMADDATLLLTSAQIVRRRIARAKAKHAETRMRFLISISNSTPQTLTLASGLEQQLAVKSSRGKNYSILSATAQQTRLAPGEQTELEIWVQDGPQWFGTRYLSVEIPATILGNKAARILSKNMDEVERLEVEQF